MDKFLETHNLSKVNQEESENLNRQVTARETVVVIKKTKLPTNKNPGPGSFTDECYQTFQEKLILLLLKRFQKVHEEGRLLSSFDEACIIVIPKPDKRTTKK